MGVVYLWSMPSFAVPKCTAICVCVLRVEKKERAGKEGKKVTAGPIDG